MKFAANLILLCLPMLLGACRTTAPSQATHGPVSDRVMRKLNEHSLSKEEFAQALVQKGIQPILPLPAGEVRLPFKIIDGVPIVHCRINGHRPVPLIFDTGASHTMLNAADALKLKVMTLRADAGAVPMIGVMGVEQGRFAMMDTLAIGDWRISGYPCLVRTHQNGVQGKAPSHVFQPNLLGFDLAAESASYLTVDYRRGEITYGFGQPFQPPSGPRVANSRFKQTKGVPFTRISIGGYSWDALIDTGSFNGIEITTALAKRLGVHEQSRPVEGLSVFGVGGTMSSAEAGLRTVTVRQVQACGLVHRMAKVDIAPGTPRIGSAFFKDYRVTFDLRRKRIWLEW